MVTLDFQENVIVRCLLAMALIIPSAVQAQEDTPSAGSAAVRAKKNWGVGLGLGTFMLPVSGASLQGFYALSASNQAELQFWSGTRDDTSFLDDRSSVTLQKFDVNATQSQIRLKHFFGNSLYLAGGIGNRTIEFDLEASDPLGARLTGKLKSNAMILNIALGNTWTFDDGLFIGGEWIAFAVPMGADFSTDLTITGPSSGNIDSLRADAEKNAKYLGEISTAGLATVHLGFQF